MIFELIDIESLEKYLEHRIEPPISLPKMREKYLVLISQMKDKEDELLQEKIKQMAFVWEKKVLLL